MSKELQIETVIKLLNEKIAEDISGLSSQMLNAARAASFELNPEPGKVTPAHGRRVAIGGPLRQGSRHAPDRSVHYLITLGDAADGAVPQIQTIENIKDLPAATIATVSIDFRTFP